MNDSAEYSSPISEIHLLQVEEITKKFAGLTALLDVSFGIKRGHIKALIGPNGAGKTTLLNVISGLLSPDRGQVLYKGKDLTRLRPNEIAGLGLSRTFQLIRLFTTNNANVLDNLMMGAHLKLKPSVIKSIFLRTAISRQEKEMRERAWDMLKFVGLEWAADYLPAALSFGNQRLLEIARALMSAPEILLLDEPASGLNESEVDDFKQRLLDIKEKGTTILLVEHNMKLVMDVADEIIVLEFGQKLAEGNCDEICCDQKVIEAYLGPDYMNAVGSSPQ